MLWIKKVPPSQEEMDKLLKKAVEMSDKNLEWRLRDLESINEDLRSQLEVERRVNEALRSAMNLKSALTI